jgi:hypothetical protein
MRTRFPRGLVLLALVGACASPAETAVTTTTSPAQTTTSDAPTATTSSLATTTTIVEVTTTSLPPFPPGRQDLEHGGPTWAVVLAGAATADDPAIQDAIQAATDAGYSTGPTDCDEGAAEALGQSGEILTISVYLEDEADARAAALAFDARGVDGVVAEIRTFCLD